MTSLPRQWYACLKVSWKDSRIKSFIDRFEKYFMSNWKRAYPTNGRNQEKNQLYHLHCIIFIWLVFSCLVCHCKRHWVTEKRIGYVLSPGKIIAFVCSSACTVKQNKCNTQLCFPLKLWHVYRTEEISEISWLHELVLVIVTELSTSGCVLEQKHFL